MLTASNLPPKDIELVRREIQEIREALEAFKAAVEAGEMTGFNEGGMRAARRLFGRPLMTQAVIRPVSLQTGVRSSVNYGE